MCGRVVGWGRKWGRGGVLEFGVGVLGCGGRTSGLAEETQGLRPPALVDVIVGEGFGLGRIEVGRLIRSSGRKLSFGAVSFLHRFGSSLNPHFHYHLCVVDGLFQGPEDDTDPNPTGPGGVRKTV
jgi:hypothetical protein